jgi:hypothetical protein
MEIGPRTNCVAAGVGGPIWSWWSWSTMGLIVAQVQLQQARMTLFWPAEAAPTHHHSGLLKLHLRCAGQCQKLHLLACTHVL